MSADPSGEQPVLLSTALATRADWRLALPVVLLSLAAFFITIPFVKQQFAYVWAFIPTYQTALAITDLMTAGLLLAQFNITRSRAMLVLACGYLFTGCMVVPHTLVVPRPVLRDGTVRRQSEDHGLALHVLARRISARRDGLCVAQEAATTKPPLAYRNPRGRAGPRSFAASPSSLRRPWPCCGSRPPAPRCCRRWCRTASTPSR